MLEFQQLKLKAEKSSDRKVLHSLCEKLHLNDSDIDFLNITRKSLDARKKPDLYYIYNVIFSLKNPSQEHKLLKRKNNNLKIYKPVEWNLDASGYKPRIRPVIVGAGPAGLFAALVLAKKGFSPLILERGKKVDDRLKDIEDFWKNNILDPTSNVSFGEGGAGTFSDGKLTTQVNDKSGRNQLVLKTFRECGAGENILYDAKPHIGTDVLVNVIKNLRNMIISLGGEFSFESCVTDFRIENNILKAIEINDDRWIECQDLILAIGHSARDTIDTLYKRNVPMISKPFALGFRVEHPRDFIDKWQYGSKRDDLPAASYKLTANLSNGRGVYSFCMCPGGYVVNASSEPGTLVVNGMSYSGRNGQNSNSAIVVTVGQHEYDINDPLGAMKYQLRVEKAAYEAGKGKIPQQLYGDFKANKISSSYGAFSSSVKGMTIFSNLRDIFSKEINDSFIEGMDCFDRKIKGFSGEECILSGIESRTSSPVRIIRNEDGRSEIKGLYPAGEGAGYAGGIMSAAMDGIKIAEKVILSHND